MSENVGFYPIRRRAWIEGALICDEETHESSHSTAETWCADILTRFNAVEKLHLFEIEFIDEPDQDDRFVRFGTDSARMVTPRWRAGIPGFIDESKGRRK